MTKSSIYTKTGDQGLTGLVGGQRVSKDCLAIECYGSVDELNSFLGLLLSKTDLEKDFFTKIQNILFNLGSTLACNKEDRLTYKIPTVNEKNIADIENKLDQLDSSLEKLKNFILPGGCEASSLAHVCRVVCRRLERLMVTLLKDDDSLTTELKFVNRLSDLFFVYARFINKNNNAKEILWSKN